MSALELPWPEIKVLLQTSLVGSFIVRDTTSSTIIVAALWAFRCWGFSAFTTRFHVFFLLKEARVGGWSNRTIHILLTALRYLRLRYLVRASDCHFNLKWASFAFFLLPYSEWQESCKGIQNDSIINTLLHSAIEFQTFE